MHARAYARQRVEFPWDLYWVNKTYKHKEIYCVPDVKPVNFLIAFTSLVECLEIPSPLSFELGIPGNF